MDVKVIARVVNVDQKSVDFALRGLVERSILVEEETSYYLNPEFEEPCKKLVDIYKAIKLSKGREELYGIYLEEFEGQSI